MAKTKQIIAVAEELQDILKPKPPIDTSMEVEKLKEILAVDAAPLLNVKDRSRLSDETVDVLAELVPKYMDNYKEQDLKTFRALGILPEEDDDIEDAEQVEEDDDTEEEINLVEEIKQAERLRDLKDIVHDEDIFKGLRRVLSKYNTKEELRDVMLECFEKGQPDEKPGTEAEKKEIPKQKTTPGTKNTTKQEKKPAVKKTKVEEKTYAKVFAEIYNEKKSMTVREFAEEISNRRKCSKYGARTFAGIYIQILHELGFIEKTDDGKYMKV